MVSIIIFGAIIAVIFPFAVLLPWSLVRSNRKIYKYRGPAYDKGGTYKLFEFMDSHPRRAHGSSTHFVKGRREWVHEFVPFSEFPTRFGGWILWDKPFTDDPDIPGQAIGVWGRRNVSRLKRLMRERGAKFEVVNQPGPAQKIISKASGRVDADAADEGDLQPG